MFEREHLADWMYRVCGHITCSFQVSFCLFHLLLLAMNSIVQSLTSGIFPLLRHLAIYLCLQHPPDLHSDSLKSAMLLQLGRMSSVVGLAVLRKETLCTC